MFNPENLLSEKNKSLPLYEQGNLSFDQERTESDYQVAVTKKIIDALAPYMKVKKVRVQFKPMKSQNAGANSIMNKQFRDADYYDSITINSKNEKTDELPFTLIHELGHSFEEMVEEILETEKSEALPIRLDETYACFYADLLACYILRPELLKKLEDNQLAKNSISIMKRIFEDNNFLELKNELEELVKNEIKQKSPEQTSNQDLENLFNRIFEKIALLRK